MRNLMGLEDQVVPFLPSKGMAVLFLALVPITVVLLRTTLFSWNVLDALTYLLVAIAFGLTVGKPAIKPYLHLGRSRGRLLAVSVSLVLWTGVLNFIGSFW